MRHSLLRVFLAVLAIGVAIPALTVPAAAFDGENLLVGLPQGYKVGYSVRKGNMQMSEMVPEAQTVDNWSEMLTVQVFLNDRGSSPAAFFQTMQKGYRQACGEVAAIEVAKGEENGYPFSFFHLTCPLNPATGKPEITWFKTIRGKDSFYVVQKAWKERPSTEAIIEWSKFMRKVAVCDTRSKAHDCGFTDGKKAQGEKK
jgi:hypothetical protein